MEKKEFTFGVVTYNHEDYILTHLESIKYLIEMYGSDYDMYLIISDDCSEDRTIERAKEWVAINDRLFKNISIFINIKNSGTVHNYLSLQKQITTFRFKVLAGDDFYYKNNIFEISEKSNFIVTPPVLYENGEFYFDTSDVRKELLSIYSAEKRKKFLKAEIKGYSIPYTPGVIYDGSLVNKELYESLENYHYIEDIPMWNAMLANDSINVSASSEPYIVYRLGSGISTDKGKKTINKRYESDKQRIDRDICIDKNKTKYLVPYVYKRKFIFMIKNIFIYKHVADIKHFLDKSKSIHDEAKEFYELLYSRTAW